MRRSDGAHLGLVHAERPGELQWNLPAAGRNPPRACIRDVLPGVSRHRAYLSICKLDLRVTVAVETRDDAPGAVDQASVLSAVDQVQHLHTQPLF